MILNVTNWLGVTAEELGFESNHLSFILINQKSIYLKK